MAGLQIKYFVLKPAGRGPYAKASKAAMLRYASAIVGENPDLAQDLADWVARENNAIADEVIEEITKPTES